MLERIHLENFKVSRDVDVRLAPLTILAGLNSSGKSTLLQALGALRQSYSSSGPKDGILLSGELVQLGKFRDLLTEGSSTDQVSISVTEEGQRYCWRFGGPPYSDEVKFAESPLEWPPFLASRHFQFLHADRIVPATMYDQASQRARDAGFLGARGEFAVDFLAEQDRLSVSEKRSFPRQGLGLSEDLLGKIAPTDGIRDQVAGWLQQLSPGARLHSTRVSGTDNVLLQYQFHGRRRDPGSNDYRPTNVGFGLTYCLPIVVAALAAPAGSLLLLENPEAHLHPQGQSAMGELVARTASDGVQLIVETHSDHLLNGVRLAVKRGLLSANDVAIHFFTREVETGEAFVQTPAILESGRLSNWPSGFFDQWDKDIDALLD